MLVAAGGWTRWWDMGVWARGTDTIKRHSVDSQRAGDWRVLTDTLQSIGPLYADAYQYRLTLLSKGTGHTPRVRAIYVTASNSYRNGDVLVGANEERHDATPSQVALAWLLGHSPVMLPIPGTSSVAHLEENVAAATLELMDEEMAMLERS